MEFNEKQRKNSIGITLIALVITIIVLLILAGVSIAMLTGQNGILTQAQNAKNRTEEAQIEEENKLNQYNNIINDYANGGTGDQVVVGEIVTGGNKTYTNNGTAIIPDGFAIVPGLDDVSQGLVISDVENDTNDTGNQFVWIPVTEESKYVRNRTYFMEDISTTAYTGTGYLPEGIQPEVDDSEHNEEAEKQAVMNAKGFYVSRYEAGLEYNDGLKLVSKKGAEIYNRKSYGENVDYEETSKSFVNNDYVKSALCSGIQWDVIMDFVDGKKDGKGNDFYVTQGNSNRHVGELKEAGQNEYDRVCNIYDLEGNC